MATIVTRAGKASPLTNQELDSNFNNLNTDKAELSGAVFTGAITTNSTIDGRDVAADGVTADAALPKSGGAMTGAITTNSTFDGRDVAADGVTADAALPKSGGAMTGAITTNSTFDGRDVAADGVTADAALPKAGGAMTGAITTNSTFDGVDIATRDAVLTSTTTTANAALPKAGGAVTGDISFGDNDKAIFGAGSDATIFSDGTAGYMRGFILQNKAGDKDVLSFVDGGATSIYHNNSAKLATTSTGIDVTGTVTTSGDIILPSAGKLYSSGDTDSFLQFNQPNTLRAIIGDSTRMIIEPNTTVFNEDSANVDFRVEGNNRANLLVVDGGKDMIGIGMYPDQSWGSNSVGINFGIGDVDAGAITWQEISGADQFNFTWNAYNDNTNWKFASGNPASRYYQYNGSHYFQTAAPTSADANITFVENLSLAPTAVVFNEGGGDVDFRVEAVNQTHALFVEGSSGNVGIGVSNPSDYYAKDLVVTGPSEGGITIASTGNHTNYLLFADSTSGVARYAGMVEYAHTIDAMSFRTNSIQRMTISSSGKVGIGISNPSDYYTNFNDLVLGNTSGHSGMTIASGTTHDGTIAFADGTSGTAEYKGYIQYNHEVNTLTFGTDHTNRMTINSSGDVLINCTSSEAYPGATFSAQANGTTLCSNTTASGYEFQTFRYYNGQQGVINLVGTSGVNYGESSDYRLKENVSYTWDATTKLKQLKPAQFSWISDETNTRQDGFIAHEVAEVVPRAVCGEKDAMEPYVDEDGDDQTRIKPQQLDTGKLVPLLVKTIQELEARITALED